jgi:hypothetical protein
LTVPVELEALAEYVARVWLRGARLLRDPESSSARKHSRERASAIRAAIRQRDFAGALDAMTSAGGVAHFLLLERAFPLMSESERAAYLRHVWCRAKVRVPLARSLRLFHAATVLRESIPAEWPSEVQVFRGTTANHSWSDPWRRARGLVRRGVSWTTDRTTAAEFATGPERVGCLAIAAVPRSSVLAYFHEEQGVEIGGRSFEVEGYHENECIIDPSTLEKIDYERIDSSFR